MSATDSDIQRLATKAVAALHSTGLLEGKQDSMQLQAFKSLTQSITSSARINTSGGAVVNPIEAAASRSSLYDPNVLSAPPLKKPKETKPVTAGKGWFDLRPLEMDESIKRDIKVIQMRNYMDPKRFYKNPDKPGMVLHVGTVIEGPYEYSNRLTNKERRQTITEEIMADASVRQYTKRKYGEIQKEKNNKRRTFKPLRSKKRK
jgi:hypothetical protein